MYDTGDIQWVPFPDHMVAAVDRIVSKAKLIGVEGRVETRKQWDLVVEIYDLWAHYYPQEYATFHQQQVDLKRNQFNEHGSKREPGGAEVQHVVEIPRRFYNLLKGIFPEVDRQLVGSKEFAMKLAKHMPLLQVAEKI